MIIIYLWDQWDYIFKKNINQNNFKEKSNIPRDSKIPNKIKKFRCGISWKSTNRIFGNKKSIELESLKSILTHE